MPFAVAAAAFAASMPRFSRFRFSRRRRRLFSDATRPQLNRIHVRMVAPGNVITNRQNTTVNNSRTISPVNTQAVTRYRRCRLLIMRLPPCYFENAVAIGYAIATTIAIIRHTPPRFYILFSF